MRPWHVELGPAELRAYREAMHRSALGPLRILLGASFAMMLAHASVEMLVLHTVPQSLPIMALGVFGMLPALLATHSKVGLPVRDLAVGALGFFIAVYEVLFSAYTDGPGLRVAQSAPFLSILLILVGPTLRTTLLGMVGQIAGVTVADRVLLDAPIWPASATLVGVMGSALLVLLALVVEGARRLAYARLLELGHAAQRDPLTGLLNRRAFEAAVASSPATTLQRPACLLMLDLDRFKGLNDTQGHLAGDEALVAVARALRQILPPTDPVARIGGDEFAALLLDLDESGAAPLAERVRAEVRSQGVGTTCSIGLAAARPGAPMHALREADAALYRAKAAGGDAVMSPIR